MIQAIRRFFKEKYINIQAKLVFPLGDFPFGADTATASGHEKVPGACEMNSAIISLQTKDR